MEHGEGRALYLRIADALRQRILSGGHPVGDLLPSENELSDAYRTSRVTVRKAFQILESEGYIKARQGKGYIVQPPRHALFTLIFGDEESRREYRCLEVRVIPPPAHVARSLALEGDTPVIAIRRILEREGVPLAYEEKFLLYERGRPTAELELGYAEFADYFSDRFAAVSLRTELRVRATLPPAHVRLALGSGEERLLAVDRLVLSPGGERIGFSREYLTPEYGPLRAFSGRSGPGDGASDSGE